jgi:hypothetical protein
MALAMNKQTMARRALATLAMTNRAELVQILRFKLGFPCLTNEK